MEWDGEVLSDEKMDGWMDGEGEVEGEGEEEGEDWGFAVHMRGGFDSAVVGTFCIKVMIMTVMFLCPDTVFSCVWLACERLLV